MTRRRSRRRTLVRRLSFATRLIASGAVVAAALGLGSCAIMPGRYASKGDVRPHQGVAAAHQLPIHGIDISKWQGRSTGPRSDRRDAVRLHQGDRRRRPRRRALPARTGTAPRRAGVPRGAYHFVYWCRPAEEQAAWFKRNVPDDPDALPPVLDVEWNGHSSTCPGKSPPRQALEHDPHTC